MTRLLAACAPLRLALRNGISNLIHGKPEGFWNAIGNEYTRERDRVREGDRVAQSNSPNLYTGADVAGSLAAPVGVVGKVAKAGVNLARGGEALNAAAAASPRIAKIAKYLQGSSVARAVGAGAGQGALNAAGNSEWYRIG
jgi:hypothetical protein